MFNNIRELTQFVEERKRAAAPSRLNLARSEGVSQAYYIGMQWVSLGIPLPGNVLGGLGRLRTDMNPDSNVLRATINRVARFVIKETAATWPGAMDIEVDASDSDTGIQASVNADVAERFANMLVEYSSFLQTAQDAQAMRCLCGLWGMGLYMADSVRTVNGEKVLDRQTKTFDFDPVRLILDPGCTRRRLIDHEFVIYEDAWTLEKVRRVYGNKVQFDEEKMPTFGQLVATELEMNRLSQGQLYPNYRVHSQTRATTVCQVHTKDETGRFGRMDVLVRNDKGDYQWINEDNPVSPFGGSGLPLILMHGHRRPGSIASIGAATMMKDDQDRINLLGTLFFRQVRANSGHQTFIDKRLFPRDTSDEAIAQRVSNRVGGVTIIESRPDKNIFAPQVVQTPPPQPFITDTMQQYEASMMQQVFRAEGHFGLGAKSHVPFATTDRILEEADQVLGIRVKEDVTAYRDLLEVLVGTNISHVKAESPGLIVKLREKGFDEQDFSVLLQTDEYCPPWKLNIRESSVRFRSLTSKQQSLDQALVNKAISAMDYRMQQADLDTPLTSGDKDMHSSLKKKVARTVQGEPWYPVPLGDYNDMAVRLLRQALLSREAQRDPETQKRVTDAILAQLEAQGQEQALVQSAMAALQPQAQPASSQQQGDPNAPVPIEDLLNQVAGGSPGVPA